MLAAQSLPNSYLLQILEKQSVVNTPRDIVTEEATVTSCILSMSAVIKRKQCSNGCTTNILYIKRQKRNAMKILIQQPNHQDQEVDLGNVHHKEEKKDHLEPLIVTMKSLVVEIESKDTTEKMIAIKEMKEEILEEETMIDTGEVITKINTIDMKSNRAEDTVVTEVVMITEVDAMIVEDKKCMLSLKMSAFRRQEKGSLAGIMIEKSGEVEIIEEAIIIVGKDTLTIIMVQMEEIIEELSAKLVVHLN